MPSLRALLGTQDQHRANSLGTGFNSFNFLNRVDPHGLGTRECCEGIAIAKFRGTGGQYWGSRLLVGSAPATRDQTVD
jgi:hypothetical protein